MGWDTVRKLMLQDTPPAQLAAAMHDAGLSGQSIYAQTLAADGAVVFDASKGATNVVTLQANCTSSSIINGFVGARLRLVFLQDATGGRTYAYPSDCKFAGGAAPSDTTLNKQTSVDFEYNGAHWLERSRAVAVG